MRKPQLITIHVSDGQIVNVTQFVIFDICRHLPIWESIGLIFMLSMRVMLAPTFEGPFWTTLCHLSIGLVI